MKSKDVRIRFEPEELAVIDSKAEELGLSRSEFIRSTLARPIMGPDEFQEAVSQMLKSSYRQRYSASSC